jgi:protein Mpv17
MSRLATKFNSYYAEKPSMFASQLVFCRLLTRAVLTMMITNAVLGGIADTVAQSITSIRLAALRKPGGIRQDDTMAIEIHELDRKNPLNELDLIPNSSILPPPFDFERLTRFMAYGFMMAPVQFTWFKFLSKTFPITKESGFGAAMKMVAFDQLIFAPVGMYILYGLSRYVLICD